MIALAIPDDTSPISFKSSVLDCVCPVIWIKELIGVSFEVSFLYTYSPYLFAPLFAPPLSSTWGCYAKPVFWCQFVRQADSTSRCTPPSIPISIKTRSFAHKNVLMLSMSVDEYQYYHNWRKMRMYQRHPCKWLAAGCLLKGQNWMNFRCNHTRVVKTLTFTIIPIHIHIFEVKMTQQQSNRVNTAPKRRWKYFG